MENRAEDPLAKKNNTTPSLAVLAKASLSPEEGSGGGGKIPGTPRGAGGNGSSCRAMPGGVRNFRYSWEGTHLVWPNQLAVFSVEVRDGGPKGYECDGGVTCPVRHHTQDEEHSEGYTPCENSGQIVDQSGGRMRPLPAWRRGHGVERSMNKKFIS